MDYGIARIDSNSMTKTGIAMGTPNYVTPEQLAEPGIIWTEIAILGAWLVYPGLWGAILSSAFGSALGGCDEILFIPGAFGAEEYRVYSQFFGLAHADGTVRCGGGDKK